MNLEDKKFLEVVFDGDIDGVRIISLVDNPANMSNFVALSKIDNESNIIIKDLKLSSDEKRIITGAVLIPEQIIERSDYKFKVSDVQIEKLFIDFAKKGFKGVNLNHDNNNITEDVFVIESWIVNDENNDKSNSLGMNFPRGTWMQSYKVNNDRIWADIKAGVFNGFSMEGILKYKAVEDKNNTNNDKINMTNLFNKTKTMLATLLEEFKSNDTVKLADTFILADGTEVIVDEVQTIKYADGSDVPNGEYVLNDGRTIIVADGKVSEIKEVETVDNIEANKVEDAVNSTEPVIETVENMNGEMIDIAIDNGVYTVVDGVKTEEFVPSGEYIMDDNSVISVDENGQMTELTAGELLRSVWGNNVEMSAYVEELSKIKKEYKEFRQGFGGQSDDVKLSKVPDTDTVKTNTKVVKSELDIKLEKLSGYMRK